MNTPLLTDYDLYLLAQGTHYRSYEKLGAHLVDIDGQRGTRFAVWAPNAEAISVIGDFNDWDTQRHPMALRHAEAGIWECFIPGVGVGALYKYFVASRFNGYKAEKADPYAFASELRPRSASKVWDLSGYAWGDAEWLAARRTTNPWIPTTLLKAAPATAA